MHPAAHVIFLGERAGFGSRDCVMKHSAFEPRALRISFFASADARAPSRQLVHGKGGDRQEDRHSYQLEEAHQAGE